MLPKSVSPRFVWFAVVAVMTILIFPLILIESALRKVLGLRPDQGAPISIGVCIAIAYTLVPKALSYLGIAVRSRSVERFQAADRDNDESAVDLPILVYRAEWLIRVAPTALFLGGLVCLVLALCMVFTWFPPPPGARDDPLVFTVALLGIAFVLLAGAFLVGRCKPDLVCEISDKGIRAPEGFWGRLTFVPWEDLARCEIVHDDEKIWCDHFVLWDRAGRRRFKSFQNSWGMVRPSDRTRILRVLRSRFPQKAKPDPNVEPALAGAVTSAVWDRELDG